MAADQLRDLQSNDKTLDKIRQYIQDETTENEKNTNNFIGRDGIIYRQWRSRKTSTCATVEHSVLPVKCWKMALKLAYTIPMGGYMGVKKTTDRLLKRFYWPNVFHDTKEYCYSCANCQKSVTGKRQISKAPLEPLPVISTPFERIAIDIVGPLERTKSGNKYILLMCDYATRWPEAEPLKSIEVECVAEKLE